MQLPDFFKRLFRQHRYVAFVQDYPPTNQTPIAVAICSVNSALAAAEQETREKRRQENWDESLTTWSKAVKKAEAEGDFASPEVIPPMFLPAADYVNRVVRAVAEAVAEVAESPEDLIKLDQLLSAVEVELRQRFLTDLLGSTYLTWEDIEEKTFERFLQLRVGPVREKAVTSAWGRYWERFSSATNGVPNADALDTHMQLLGKILHKQEISVETWAAKHSLGRTVFFEWQKRRRSHQSLKGKVSRQKAAAIEAAIEKDAHELGLMTRTRSD